MMSPIILLCWRTKVCALFFKKLCQINQCNPLIPSNLLRPYHDEPLFYGSKGN
ncbi:hypothetical protein OIU79_004800 [Salix purpurea]|uniref:Uncharacterized protein n=1 Tax=Salix purpurea TaxID=77065 RepID=A0A9Q0UB12_SALPP|nr:hypothetical protein OIU79_004800 [Salix purpurea]